MTTSSIALSQEGCKKAVEVALKSNIPIMIYGAGGLGKSTIIRQIALDFNLELIDIRMSQILPFDLLGYPKDYNGRMEYLPLADIPIETDKVPNGKQGWLIFMDEFNSADKYTMGACYKLILDRQIGKHNVHPNCLFVCAGNRIQDNGLVNKLLTPMATRLTHIEMVIDNQEFLDYVWKETQVGNWHPFIYAFLNFKPDQIHNYDPKVTDVTHSNPRTWSMLSQQLMNGLLDLGSNTYTPIILGIVGESAGMDFVAFVESFKEIPTVQEIEQDPMNTRLPVDIGAKWALGIYLAKYLNKNNRQQIVEYASRIKEEDLRVVIYRYMVKADKSLMTYPTIAKTLVQTQKVIAGLNP